MSVELAHATISNAVYVGLALAWFHSVKHNDGVITWKVDGLGEGLFEAFIFFGLWLLSTLATMNLLRQRNVRRTPETTGANP